MRPSSLRSLRRAQPLPRDRRASVTLIAAIAMPVCVGVMALGIDVSYWEVKQIQLQRIADVAALAGSVRYSQTNNATSAVRSAASVAELNGVPAGTGSSCEVAWARA